MLFPGGRLPLRIFEQRYMEMAKACLRDGSPFGICLIREGQEVLGSGGAPAVPAEVGCVARIVEWDMAQLGVLQIVAHGEQRFRILERRVQEDGLALASIELLADIADCEIPPACDTCVRVLARVIEQHASLFERPHRLQSSAWVSARLAEILPLPLPVKQQLLELADSRARLEQLNGLLAPADAGAG